ncbi:hypothetical protein SARC_13926, partial [Sphaeroforma arctica JP610]
GVYNDKSSVVIGVYNDKSDVVNGVYNDKSDVVNGVYNDKSDVVNGVYNDKSDVVNGVFKDILPTAVPQAIEAAGATIINTGIGWHEARVPTIVTSVPRAAYALVTAKMKKE